MTYFLEKTYQVAVRIFRDIFEQVIDWGVDRLLELNYALSTLNLRMYYLIYVGTYGEPDIICFSKFLILLLFWNFFIVFDR
jgi:hypothetical protein